MVNKWTLDPKISAVIIGVLLLLIFSKSFCTPSPTPPVIDEGNIQKQTDNLQRNADNRLQGTLGNINNKISEADAKVKQAGTNRNVTAKELEDKLKK